MHNPPAAALAAGLCLALLTAGCASTPTALQGLGAAAERADTDASLAYVAIATAVNDVEALAATTPAERDRAEALKTRAYAALQAAHRAYAAGRAPDLEPLRALLREAAALKER